MQWIYGAQIWLKGWTLVSSWNVPVNLLPFAFVFTWNKASDALVRVKFWKFCSKEQYFGVRVFLGGSGHSLSSFTCTNNPFMQVVQSPIHYFLVLADFTWFVLLWQILQDKSFNITHLSVVGSSELTEYFSQLWKCTEKPLKGLRIWFIWGGKLGGDVLWRVNNHSFYRGQILWDEI